MRISMSFLFFVTFLFMLGIGATLHDDGKSIDEVYNLTSRLDWNEKTYNFTLESVNNQTVFANRTTGRLKNIMYKFIDFIGYTGFEGAKIGIELGYENPQYDYITIGKLLIYLYLAVLLLPFLLPLIAILWAMWFYGKKGILYLKSKRALRK